jgi:hypothetical protein
VIGEHDLTVIAAADGTLFLPADVGGCYFELFKTLKSNVACNSHSNLLYLV